MIQARVSVENLDEVVRELKKVEPTAIRQLRSDLKVTLGGPAGAVASEIPRQSPLRQSRKGGGMTHRGKTRWRGVNKPRVEFTPGKTRRGAHRLVNIAFTGGARGLGFDYAELAGIRRRPPKTYSKEYQRRGDSVIRQHRISGQGDGFIKALEDQVMEKPGRFAFSGMLRKRPEVTRLAIDSIRKATDKINKSLRVRL